MSRILIIIKDLAPGVQNVNNAIHRIKNLYPGGCDSAMGFPNTYPLDSDPYTIDPCPLTFEQPGSAFDGIIHEILFCFYLGIVISLFSFSLLTARASNTRKKVSLLVYLGNSLREGRGWIKQG